MNRLHLATLGLLGLFSFALYAAPTVPMQNLPVVKGYPVAEENKVWQVSSVYGPRDAGTGSKNHRGIDYNQKINNKLGNKLGDRPGDADLGVMIKAREKGAIANIGLAPSGNYISIKSSTARFKGRLAYVHIFDKATVRNVNTVAAGYNKVVLGTAKNNAGTGSCNAIFFYNTVNQVVKILTTSACSKYVYTYTDPVTNVKAKVSMQTSVAREEDIAPIGKSGTDNAHLHLQLNGGADSALTQIVHPTGLIKSKSKRFEVKLVKDTFYDSDIQAMTEGEGVVVQITENSLVPVLDWVSIDSNVTAGSGIFIFGGREGREPYNVSTCKKNDPSCNIDPAYNFSKGGSGPMIKPEDWKEMGTPRTMTFFVPYNLSALPDASVVELWVLIQTIDDDPTTFKSFIMHFAKNPRFFKVNYNREKLPLDAKLGDGPDDWVCTYDSVANLIWELHPEKHLFNWYDPNYLPDSYDVYGYYDYANDPDGIWAGWENPEKPPMRAAPPTSNSVAGLYPIVILPDI